MKVFILRSVFEMSEYARTYSCCFRGFFLGLISISEAVKRMLSESSFCILIGGRSAFGVGDSGSMFGMPGDEVADSVDELFDD